MSTNITIEFEKDEFMDALWANQCHNVIYFE
jgi:hypothetical protein